MKNEEDGRKRRSSGAKKAKSKKFMKRERQAAEDLEEERRLTALLFGDIDAEEVADPAQVSFSNNRYGIADGEEENKFNIYRSENGDVDYTDYYSSTTKNYFIDTN